MRRSRKSSLEAAVWFCCVAVSPWHGRWYWKWYKKRARKESASRDGRMRWRLYMEQTADGGAGDNVIPPALCKLLMSLRTHGRMSLFCLDFGGCSPFAFWNNPQSYRKIADTEERTWVSCQHNLPSTLSSSVFLCTGHFPPEPQYNPKVRMHVGALPV